MFGFFRRGRRSKTVAVGIAFGSDGAAVARVRAGGRDAPPRVDFLARLSATDPSALSRQLDECADEHGLAGLPATGVLAPGEYQVVQVEAPNVPAAEMRQAAGWRVRDLIDFPIDQAIMDVFDPPESAQRGQAMINVVVARRELVGERIELLRETGFGLEAIDIPDLAQRNVSARLPEARGGHALLALERTGGLLTVYRDGELFLARALDTGLEVLESGAGARGDNLMLEIQRSFDYFESALAQPPVGALYIYPGVSAVTDFIESEFAPTSGSVEARGIALSDLVDVDDEPGDGRATALHAVGAALRSHGAAS